MRDRIAKLVFALVVLVVAIGPAFAGGTQQQAAGSGATLIRWFGSRGVPNQDAPIVAMMEDAISARLGYEIEFELSGTPDDNFQPVLQLALAAQELPDVFLWFGVEDDFTRQAVAKFPLSDMKTHMPQLSSFLVGLMGDLGLEEDETWARYQDDQGMMWGTPRIWDMGWVPAGQIWRQDLLDELGVELPTTLAEAEAVFAAYKAAYPTQYPLGASGRSPSWQAFDIVFNAFGIVNGGHDIIDGTVRQYFATPQYRQALEVLARWYNLGYIDPEFINQDNQEKMRAFSQGRQLVVDWIGYANWDFSQFSPNLSTLKDNVPNAVPVVAPHLRATENQRPLQRVWNPFLGQIVAFGKHLEQDTEHLYKVMAVGDLISQDREINYLAGYGVEGEHYVLDPGEVAPRLADSLQGTSAADLTEQYGFGFFWNGRFSQRTPLPSRHQRSIDQYVLAPNGPYNQSRLDYWLSGVITGAVRDQSGQDLGAMLAADTNLDPWVMSTQIILGQQPISFYDSWLQNWYRSGGTAWETHATRLYGN